MKFSTKAVHSGMTPDPTTGALMPPIFMTSTYEQQAPGVAKGYEYTRAGNPNFTFLEENLASLENAKFATVFSAGIAALSALITTLSSGDTVVAMDGVYGGTYRLFNMIFNKFGVKFVSVYPKTMDELDRILEKEKPKWLFWESPTNPLLHCFDIEGLSKMAHKHNALAIMDNTFASPYFQNPLDLGVDVVWHSTTKYVGGHSDIIGGAAMTNHAHIKKQLDFNRKSLGVNPSPFDAWLANRGVRTLALRMKQHGENAMAVAQFLEKHPKVKKVYYPGLPSHPDHEIAKKQMHNGFGGMVSVEFNMDLEAMKKLISSFKYFTLAESLGGVESLVCHPATMTHASIPAEERKKIGLTDGLVRLSVGIEDKEDLIEDLKIALG